MKREGNSGIKKEGKLGDIFLSRFYGHKWMNIGSMFDGSGKVDGEFWRGLMRVGKQRAVHQAKSERLFKSVPLSSNCTKRRKSFFFLVGLSAEFLCPFQVNLNSFLISSGWAFCDLRYLRQEHSSLQSETETQENYFFLKRLQTKGTCHKFNFFNNHSVIIFIWIR